MMCLSLVLYFLFCCQAASAHDIYLRDVPHAHAAHTPSARSPPRPAPRCAHRARVISPCVHLARKSVKKSRTLSAPGASVGLNTIAELWGQFSFAVHFWGCGENSLTTPLLCVCAAPSEQQARDGHACGAQVIDTKRMCRCAVTASHRVGPPSSVNFVPLHRERSA